MPKFPKKSLITYGAANLEEHTDSSDFEDAANLPPKYKYSRKFSNMYKNRTKNENDIFNQQLIYETSKRYKSHAINSEVWASTPVPKEKRINKDFVQDTYQHSRPTYNGKKVLEIESKYSSVRYNVIPSLTNMFRWSTNSFKHMLTIKENRTETVQTDNNGNCNDKCTNKTRKRYKKQPYGTVQPVFAVKNKTRPEIPFRQTRIPRTALSDGKTRRDQYLVTSSSQLSFPESEEEISTARGNEQLRRQRIFHMRNSNFEQQYPSRHSKYFTPCHNMTTTDLYQDIGFPKNKRASNGTMPSAPSGFWEYLLEKFNKRNHTRGNYFKRCNILPQESDFPHYHQEIEACRYNTTKGEPCTCMEGIPSWLGSQNSPSNLPQQNLLPPNSPPSNVPPQKPLKPAKKTNSKQKKGPCSCLTKKKLTQAPSPQKFSKQPKPYSPANPPAMTPCTSCQHAHDDVIQAAAQKYNGEILCIHNPPCILINGCLNIPSCQGEPYAEIWTAQDQQKIFHTQSRNGPTQYVNYEVQQCQIPEQRKEKMMQSICGHSPPCEVRRTCTKLEYDPNLHTSCVHVPMCEKIPQCMLERKRRNEPVRPCEHNPKCAHLPICTRNYLVLTAKEEVGVQAFPYPKNMVCRHEPPCILIPKCLARVISDGFVPYDAIPDCVHRPMCEMIPACCRKSAKEMISAYSQYPNCCRIT